MVPDRSVSARPSAPRVRSNFACGEIVGVPSPLGHALAGAAAAGLILPYAARGQTLVGRAWVRPAVAFGSIAVLPDLDLLWGNHSGPTHGIGAAVLAGLAAWLLVRALGWRNVDGGRVALAVAAAYGSHTLLDWMGQDSSPPIGIMALWPLSRSYFESDLHLFMAISRRYWRDGFLVHNLLAVGREIAILVPVLAAVIAARRR